MKKSLIFKWLLATVLLVSTVLFAVPGNSNAATSYLKKTNKKYEYIGNFGGDKFNGVYHNPFKVKNGYGWIISSNFGIGDDEEVQTKNGFYSYRELLLKLPVKKNKTWSTKTRMDTVQKRQIIKTNEKVKVKAGTFKKVVVVKITEKGKVVGYDYFAPNLGLILSKDAKKKTTYYLKAIKKASK